MGQCSQQGRTGRGRGLAGDRPIRRDRESLNQDCRRGGRYRHQPVLRANPAASKRDRPGPDVGDPELLESFDGADNVDEGIQSPNLMEGDRFGPNPVDPALRLG